MERRRKEEEREKRRRERDAEKEEERKEKGQDRSKNKGRKSANEYTQVCSVAVTTRRLIASSHKTAYLMNNTQTHTQLRVQNTVYPLKLLSSAWVCQASKIRTQLSTEMALVHMPALPYVSAAKIT